MPDQAALSSAAIVAAAQEGTGLSDFGGDRMA